MAVSLLKFAQAKLGLDDRAGACTHFILPTAKDLGAGVAHTRPATYQVVLKFTEVERLINFEFKLCTFLNCKIFTVY